MTFRLVAASLALYVATAALLVSVAGRWIRAVSWRTGLLLAAAPLVLTGKAMFTGGVYAPIDLLYDGEPFTSLRSSMHVPRSQTPLLYDVAYSMIPWQKAVREAVKNGRTPLWNRFVLGGEPLLAVQQAAPLHPFTWIGFLLPLGPAWTLQMSLRIFTALLCAYLFLREIGCRDAAALAGALGWGFCDFMIFWIGYPVGNALAPFPLLLLGLTRLVREPGFRGAAITACALVAIILAGHPESLLFAVTGAGVYFVALLTLDGRGHRARSIALAAAAGVLSLGLTAVQLAPLFEALPHTWEQRFRTESWARQKKSAELKESLQRSAPAVVPFVHSEGATLTLREAVVPGGYAGAMLLPLACVGLLGRGPPRWALAAAGLAGALLAARLILVTDLVTRLPLLDVAWIDYLVFLWAFAVCALAALGLQRLSEGEGRTALLAASAVTLLLVGAVLASARTEPGVPAEFLRRRALLELLPILAVALLAVPRHLALQRALPAAAAAVLFATRIAEAGGVYPTCPLAALTPSLPVLAPVARGAPERFVAVDHLFVPNVSALYEIEDVRGYESMTLRALVETFPLWCVSQPGFNRVDDLASPFLSFLNVRWALAPAGAAAPPGWIQRVRAERVTLLENTRALPRVFVPARLRSEADAARRLALLATIRNFGEQGVLAGKTGSSSAWSANGRARTNIRAYGAQSIEIDVTAEDEAVVATSIPAWPGWKATRDGAPQDLLSYNHAFLGLRVPRGSHRLVLRYLPTGVVAGSAISLVTLAVGIALWRRLRAGRPKKVLSSAAPP